LNDLENAKINFQKAKSILKGDNLTKKDDLELFNTTYWYQKQFYSFSELYNEISKL
jgi:hypothetical protein